MDPVEFVRDYIRIGKSLQKEGYTSQKRRPRIGGKGIGFLAPARYCDEVEIKTKKGSDSQHVYHWQAKGLKNLNLRAILPHGLSGELLGRVLVVGVVDENENEIAFQVKEQVLTIKDSINYARISYILKASEIELIAKINFKALFSLASNRSLEDIDNFCEITVRGVEISELRKSYTKITLKDLKDFVVRDLTKPAKRGARNVESFSGVAQFFGISVVSSQ